MATRSTDSSCRPSSRPPSASAIPAKKSLFLLSIERFRVLITFQPFSPRMNNFGKREETRESKTTEFEDFFKKEDESFAKDWQFFLNSLILF